MGSPEENCDVAQGANPGKFNIADQRPPYLKTPEG